MGRERWSGLYQVDCGLTDVRLRGQREEVPLAMRRKRRPRPAPEPPVVEPPVVEPPVVEPPVVEPPVVEAPVVEAPVVEPLEVQEAAAPVIEAEVAPEPPPQRPTRRNGLRWLAPRATDEPPP